MSILLHSSNFTCSTGSSATGKCATSATALLRPLALLLLSLIAANHFSHRQFVFFLLGLCVFFLGVFEFSQLAFFVVGLPLVVLRLQVDITDAHLEIASARARRVFLPLGFAKLLAKETDDVFFSLENPEVSGLPLHKEISVGRLSV
jgi:hypothetical protein